MSNGNARLPHQSLGKQFPPSSIAVATPRSHGRGNRKRYLAVNITVCAGRRNDRPACRFALVELPRDQIWSQAIAVNTAIALLLSAVAANASRNGYEWAVPVFYLSIALLFLSGGREARTTRRFAIRKESQT